MANSSAWSPTILVGLDGFDWQIIHPLLDSGLMPNLQCLVEGGVSGNLATLEPTLSPMLWNSIATGKRAGAHGIHGFTDVHPETGDVVPVSSLQRRCKAIWNILEQSGRKTAIVNWFASHPAEPLPHGAMISDFFQEGARPGASKWPLRPGTVFPSRLETSLAELRMHPQELAASVIRKLVPRMEEVDQSKDPRLARIAVELTKAFSVHAAATWLLERERPELLAVYFRTADLLCHFFMPFHPPRMSGVDEREFEIYHGVVDGAYRLFDLMLGAYVRLGGPGANFVILSDHGFQSGARRPPVTKDPFANPEGWHRPHGVLVLRGPKFRRDDLVHGARLTDIAPTLLAMHGLPIGRDLEGRVLMEAFLEKPDLLFIDTWEAEPGDAGRHGPEARLDSGDAELLLQQFAALGYIELPDADRAKAAAQTRRINQWNLARDHLDAGRLVEALPLLEELRHLAPDDPGPAHRLAACLLDLGLAEEGREVLDALVERLKPGALLHFLLGQIAVQKGRLGEALGEFSAARAMDSGFFNLDLMLGRVFADLGRWIDAGDAFQRILAGDPDNGEACQGMALVYLRQRYWELAAATALRAAGLQYNLPRPHFYLGLALERLGQRNNSIRALETCLMFAPRFAAAHRALARLHGKMAGGERQARHHRDRLVWLHGQAKAADGRLQCLREEIRARAACREPAPVAGAPVAGSSADGGGHGKDALIMPQSFVIVSGLPRSGTSLMMQMLHAAGLPVKTDDRRQPDEDNPAGFWEWERIKELPRNPSILNQASGRVVKVVAPLVGALPRIHRYKIIFMDRAVEETAASQQKMLSRRTPRPPKRELAHLVSALAGHREQVLKLLRTSANVELLIVRYDRLVAHSKEEADRIAAFLALPAECLEAMRAAVRPELYRIRGNGDSGSGPSAL